jgi:hypothetical protein
LSLEFVCTLRFELEWLVILDEVVGVDYVFVVEGPAVGIVRWYRELKSQTFAVVTL